MPRYLRAIEFDTSNHQNECHLDHAREAIMSLRSAVEEVSMATQFLALVLVFFAVGTAADVNLVNIGVIYSW